MYIYTHIHPQKRPIHDSRSALEQTNVPVFVVMDSHSNVCLDLKFCGQNTKVKLETDEELWTQWDNDFQESIESDIPSHRH